MDFVLDSNDTRPPLLRQAMEASRVALARGDHRGAVFQARLAVALARDVGSPAWTAEALDLLAQHHWALGRFESAAEAATEGADIYQRIGRGAAECALRCLLAGTHSELGRHDEALVTARLAYGLARQLDDEPKMLRALSMMATCHARLGDTLDAEALLNVVLERARALDDEETLSRGVNTMLVVLVQAYERAVEVGHSAAAQVIIERLQAHADVAMQLAGRQSSRFRSTVLLSNVAAARMVAGGLEEARLQLDRCIEIAREDGLRTVELKSRHRRAQCLALEGRSEDARIELEALLHALSSEDGALTRDEMLRMLGRLSTQAPAEEPPRRTTAEPPHDPDWVDTVPSHWQALDTSSGSRVNEPPR